MRNLILFLTVVLSGTFTVSAEKILPDILHAVPVLIQIPLPAGNTNYGTGVYLTESNKLFLVTAAHCIFNEINRSELRNSNAILSSFVQGTDTKDKIKFSLDLKLLNEQGRIRQHTNHDVAVIYLGYSGDRDTNGNARSFFNDGVLLLSNPQWFQLYLTVTSNCVLFTNVSDASETYVFGYPVELLNNQVSLELEQVDFDSPLIRKGIISQRNQKRGTLIMDSGIYGGNSGGPVLITEHTSNGVEFLLAGLITQFVAVETRIAPQVGVTNSVLANSGYGVAEPIDYALELMRQY